MLPAVVLECLQNGEEDDVLWLLQDFENIFMGLDTNDITLLPRAYEMKWNKILKYVRDSGKYMHFIGNPHITLKAIAKNGNIHL